MGEVYLERELNAFSKIFDEVLLFPLRGEGVLREVPANVQVNSLFINRSNRVDKKYALKKWTKANSIIKNELATAVHGQDYLRANKKEFLAQLFMNYELADQLKQSIPFDDKQNFYYSVWLDEGAVVLSMLKQQGVIDSFVLRLHGYDLYDERREGNYMPFRNYCFKHCSRVFVVSETGAEYTRNLNVYPEKVIANYSGLYDRGLTQPRADTFKIVSCSNLVPLKRVELIIDVLSRVQSDVKWTHFGDGTELSKLKDLANKLPANISVDFAGHLSNGALLQRYSNEHWSLFLHLSEHEGLPLSVVEAMSFGIPVAACDVGGVSEVVSNQEGLLLPKNPDLMELANFIDELVQDEDKRAKLAQAARQKFLKKFTAEKNYEFFVEELLNTQ